MRSSLVVNAVRYLVVCMNKNYRQYASRHAIPSIFTIFVRTDANVWFLIGGGYTDRWCCHENHTLLRFFAGFQMHSISTHSKIQLSIDEQPGPGRITQAH